MYGYCPPGFAGLCSTSFSKAIYKKGLVEVTSPLLALISDGIMLQRRPIRPTHAANPAFSSGRTSEVICRQLEQDHSRIETTSASGSELLLQ
jgi:hypothetical protein